MSIAFDQAGSPASATSPWVGRWLIFIAALIFAMVIVGGATRLTDSGLSITEWQPIMGALPPLNATDWQLAFDKYKLSSEYKLQNQGMSLAEFQTIFWWEWGHRLLGRLVGVAFVVPFILFVAFRKLPKGIWPRLLVILILGAAQGALGWYMVASGLVNRVDVSQYRLAAHLSLALFLYAAVLWTLFGLSGNKRRLIDFDDWTALLLLLLVFLQMSAGAFVAGLDAGQGYNTWPLMDGKIIPAGLDAMQPLWRNLFENALTVQFVHRMLAYLICVIALFHAIKSFRLSNMFLAYAVLMQALLGIVTLLLQAPLGAALSHQAGGVIVLTAAVWNLHKLMSINPAPDPSQL